MRLSDTPVADGDDVTDRIGALDTREGQRIALATPGRDRRGVVFGAIGALAHPDVGVVHAAGGHLDQHFAMCRNGNGNVFDVDELVQAAMASEQYRAHLGGDDFRHGTHRHSDQRLAKTASTASAVALTTMSASSRCQAERRREAEDVALRHGAADDAAFEQALLRPAGRSSATRRKSGGRPCPPRTRPPPSSRRRVPRRRSCARQRPWPARCGNRRRSRRRSSRDRVRRSARDWRPLPPRRSDAPNKSSHGRSDPNLSEPSTRTCHILSETMTPDSGA